MDNLYDENTVKLLEIIKIVTETHNDMELGKIIRKFILENINT